MRNILVLGVVALAGCGPQAEQRQANNAVAAARPEKAFYCFFKDSETKAWKASTDSQGNVVVSGKAYRQDPRYKAVLIEPKVEGATAKIWPSITQNDTGYAADNDWWNVRLTVPDSRQVAAVEVHCGAKIIASLKVPRKAG